MLEVREGETVTIGDVAVRAVPAWHDGRRRPGPGVIEHDTLGYLIGDVWFAGDTDIDDGMRALRGQVDVALIPIWGWGTSLGPGHLDPEGAARAIALVELESPCRSTGGPSCRSASGAAIRGC